MATKPETIVLGAGILGLAVAAALAKRGTRVTLIDKGKPFGGTSGTSFAWVNSNGKTPRTYHEINVAGLRMHLEWQRDFAPHFHWFHQTGAFEWVDRNGHDELTCRIGDLKAAGYDAELVPSRRATALNPGLRVPEGPVGWFAQEGYVDVSRFAASALRQIREAGGAFRFGRMIVSIRNGDVGVAVDLDDGESIEGAFIVVAGGRWSRDVLAGLDLGFAAPDTLDPSSRVRSLLAFTGSVPAQVGTLIMSPDLNLRPEGGGRLVLQSRVPFGLHESERDLRAGDVASEFTHRLRRLLPFIPDDAVQEVRIGRRSLTEDGLPAVGFVDNRIYLVVAHSGVTLAPIIGKAVAEEILDGVTTIDLSPFRPERLLTRSRARTGADVPLHSTQ